MFAKGWWATSFACFLTKQQASAQTPDTHLLVSPKSNHALNITEKNLWCNHRNLLVSWQLDSFLQLRSTQNTPLRLKQQILAVCVLLHGTRCFFPPQTIREKYPWKDQQSGGKSMHDAPTHSQAGTVWDSGGVNRVLCPAPFHLIHKPNQEKQHSTLSFPIV